MNGVHPIQLVLLGLMAIVAIVAALARRLQVSYPILLVIAGLVCSTIPHVPPVPLPPDVVFFVFLPPLLYAAAWGTSWREFRFNLVSISLLAVGLVFFTAVGVALTAHLFLPGFDWRLGFLLGAVVSPTDAVAATSIARRVGMPQTIVDLLEGESLLNDATGLLALQFGVTLIVSGTTPTFGHAVAEFVWLLGGGALVGFGGALLVMWFERWVDDGPIELVLSLLAPYATYILGEALHASGVIAVVVCGLYVSRKSATLFSSAARVQLIEAWNALEFLLNGLVFTMIGFQLPYVLHGIRGYSRLQLIVDGLVFSAVLILLRLLWMFPGARVARWIRVRWLRQNYPAASPRSVFVVGWTGMRGVVALAAASSLPLTIGDGTPLPQRNMILYLTFAVILVTLVGQGLTLPAMVRALGLTTGPEAMSEENEARRLLLERATRFLEDRRPGIAAEDTHAFDDLLHVLRDKADQFRRKPQPGSTRALSAVHLQLEVIGEERAELAELREQGRIGDGVYRTLERELDLNELRLQSRR